MSNFLTLMRKRSVAVKFAGEINKMNREWSKKEKKKELKVELLEGGVG